MFQRFLQALGVVILVWRIAVPANGAELDVSELIIGMKRAVTEAQKTATPPLMVMPWVEGEISYVVKKEGEGGFRLYVVTVEGKYATEAVQRVKFRLEPPSGTKWRVEAPGEFKEATVSGVDQVAKKVFISTVGDLDAAAYPMKVGADTKITDYKGALKTLADIKAGAKVTVEYSSAPEGFLKALSIMKVPQEIKK
jgi:hypothetical protein